MNAPEGWYEDEAVRAEITRLAYLRPTVLAESPTFRHTNPFPSLLMRLFSSRETLETFFERSDENQRFLDILEQLPENYGSEDLVTRYTTTTVRKLSPLLESLNIDLLAVDPLPDGFYWTYLPPHKAPPRS